MAASEGFSGNGSYGNGAAMRVAPPGAFCAGDPARAATEAIVGGIIGAHAPSVPSVWRHYREPLPGWFGHDA
jgi:hypothetical protein